MDGIIISKIRYTYQNEYGKYKVIHKEGNKYTVKFKNSGNIVNTTKKTLLDNKVVDMEAKKKQTAKRGKKSRLEVKIIIDNKEQLKTFDTIKTDKDFGSDGIKICSVERGTVIPKGCKVGTADLTIMVRKEGEKVWQKTKFATERKENGDIFSTLFSDMKRFRKELNRAKEAELYFFILHNFTFEDIKAHIKKLQGMRKIGYKTQPFITFLQNYLTISEEFPVICCGNYWHETVRRMIKLFIKKERLQYE